MFTEEVVVTFPEVEVPVTDTLLPTTSHFDVEEFHPTTLKLFIFETALATSLDPSRLKLREVFAPEGPEMSQYSVLQT
jgi:hypothetical protein